MGHTFNIKNHYKTKSISHIQLITFVSPVIIIKFACSNKKFFLFECLIPGGFGQSFSYN